jgi:phage terminase Nu1 subunit (DNA packaging protein)
MTSVSPQNRVTKSRISEVLGLTTRQITNLVEEGMPREVDGRHVWFDLPNAVQWYTRKLKDELRSGDDEKKNLTTRKLEVEVMLAEHELAIAQGTVVGLDYLESQTSNMLERLRAKILNLPGKYAPAMVGLRTIAEAQSRLEGAATEMIISLSETGDDPEIDDTPDSTSDLAA